MQSQLGTANSILASLMSLGVPAGTTGNATIIKSVTDNLALVSTATAQLDEYTVNSTLNLTHNATAVRDIPLSVSHTLNLVSLGGRTRTGNVTSNLSLTDIVAHFNYVGDRKPAGNTLNLTQIVQVQAALVAESSLNLTQNVVVQGPIKIAINHWLGLGHHTSTPYHMWVEDELELSEFLKSPLPINVSVNHTLNLTHDSPIGKITQNLGLSDWALYSFGLDAEDELELTDNVSVEGLWVRSATHSNFIGHSLTYLIDSPCAKKQYTPFQGENTIPANTGDTPPDTLQDPQGNVSDRFSLYTPPLGVRTSEVIIRAPELDNRDRNAYSRVNRETRGGYLTVFADPDWPQVRTLAVTVVGLTETQVDALQTFLQDTVGQLIGLTDWEGRLWRGFVTNPSEVATQDGRDRWTVVLEFEGEMLDVQQPGGNDGSTLNLTQTVTVVKV